MNKIVGTNWSAKEMHPSEEDLLYYVDGQMPSKEMEKLRTHLEACWSCRVNMEEIEATISSFVHFLNHSVAPNIEPPPHGWRGLDARINQIETETNAKRQWGQWFDLAKRTLLAWQFSRSVALASLIALFTISLILYLHRIPAVSANQLIQNTINAQDLRLRAVTQPVVYQRLEVRCKAPAPHRDQSVIWEIWNDSNHNRFKQQVKDMIGQSVDDYTVGEKTRTGDPTTTPSYSEDSTKVQSSSKGDRTNFPRQTRPSPLASPTILQNLSEVFRFNRLDIRNPLSSISFDAWRKAARRKTESVVESNLTGSGRVLTLRTEMAGPFAVNAIVRSEYVVRRSDWHPIEQHLKVQSESGLLDFALIERAFDVLTLSSLPSSIFAESRSETSPKLSAPGPLPAQTMDLRPTSAELLASEVETMLAIHKMKACLGGQIAIVRDNSGRIEVQGVVPSVERRQEILASIQGIAWVLPRVQTVEEVASSGSSGPLAGESRQVESEAPSPEQRTIEAVQAGKLPIQDLLEKYFAEIHPSANSEEGGLSKETRRIAEVSNKAVSLSEEALEEAWALRRLAEWSFSVRSEELPQSSRWAIEIMVRDHMGALRKKIDESQQLLNPILSSLLLDARYADREGKKPDDSGVFNPATTNWASNSLQLFATVERIVHLSLGLFADTNFPPEQREAAMQELQSAFARGQREFQILESYIARAFPEKPDSMTLKGRME